MAKSVVGPSVDRDWQAEEDLRTLKRAAEISRDRKRMRLMKACMKKEIKDYTRVTKYARLLEAQAAD